MADPPYTEPLSPDGSLEATKTHSSQNISNSTMGHRTQPREPLNTPGIIPVHLKTAVTQRHPLIEIIERAIYRLRPENKLDTLIALLALYHAAVPVFKWGKGFLARKCTSSLTIPEHDPVAQEVMGWMTAQVVLGGANRAMVVTGGVIQDPYDRYYRHPLSRVSAGVGGEDGGVQYVPPLGSKIFWVGFRPYLFSRTGGHKTGIYSFSSDFRDRDNPDPQPQNTIMVATLGWNLAPLQSFTKMCHEFTIQNKGANTTVFFPGKGDLVHDFEGSGSWSSVTKAIRKMDTIDMDEAVKLDLIRDAEDYYRPETKKFYADCGIPYRRGYLFHGPPGTGKTSFSAALAGYLGCDIYMINLSTGSISDSKLHRLFLQLPAKCVVVLEDIDSAGIGREVDADEERKKRKKSERAGRLAMHLHGSGRSGITLSGLLNAIDGNASQEGRLLVMTSNTPEVLDDALVRPGRIDKKISFGLISSDAAGRTFMRLVGRVAIATGKFTVQGAQAKAAEFSACLPDRVFTPAEVQNFLQDCRGDPDKAVDGVEAWAEKLMKDKEEAIEKARLAELEREKKELEKKEQNEAKAAEKAGQNSPNAANGANGAPDPPAMYPMPMMPHGGFPTSSFPADFMNIAQEILDSWPSRRRGNGVRGADGARFPLRSPGRKSRATKTEEEVKKENVEAEVAKEDGNEDAWLDDDSNGSGSSEDSEDLERLERIIDMTGALGGV